MFRNIASTYVYPSRLQKKKFDQPVFFRLLSMNKPEWILILVGCITCLLGGLCLFLQAAILTIALNVNYFLWLEICDYFYDLFTVIWRVYVQSTSSCNCQMCHFLDSCWHWQFNPSFYTGIKIDNKYFSILCL